MKWNEYENMSTILIGGFLLRVWPVYHQAYYKAEFGDTSKWLDVATEADAKAEAIQCARELLTAALAELDAPNDI